MAATYCSKSWALAQGLCWRAVHEDALRDFMELVGILITHSGTTALFLGILELVILSPAAEPCSVCVCCHLS